MKSVLCFGDSNTWGFTPVTGVRYPKEVRWPGVMAKLLGGGYDVIECGVNGRATAFDSPYAPMMNGLKALPYELLEHGPIDLLVIMLGINDMTYHTAWESAHGLSQLVRCALNSAAGFTGLRPRVLVAAPPVFGEGIRDGGSPAAENGYEEALKLAELYRGTAERWHVGFIDASKYASPSEKDSIHLEPAGHAAVAAAMAEAVRGMIG